MYYIHLACFHCCRYLRTFHFRRSWSRTRGGSRSRSRSPRHGSGFRSRYRRSHGRVSLSRSRSHSNGKACFRLFNLCDKFLILILILCLFTERKKEPLSGTATPTQDSNHGDSDSRVIPASQSIQSVVSQVPKRRCRDFDGRSYALSSLQVLAAYLITLKFILKITFLSP